MLGAIIGDIVGSPYEFANTSNPRIPLFSKDSSFTDDTLAAIVGSLAEARWGIPAEIHEKALTFLPNDMLDVIVEFQNLYKNEFRSC